jgi:hypothetical protein
VVVAVVAADRDSVTLAFARPGFALPASRLSGRPSSWNLVALGNGRCVLAETAEGVLRSLALRQSLDDIVVFLGNAGDLDDEVAARCVTIEIVPNRDTASSEPVAPWRFRAPSQVDPVTDHEPEPHVTTATPVGSVRVELLRAEPTVEGLAEPFLATLRRRCVEMTAYLAVHRGEPVTGERLRARVLGRGDDASVRTLSNTASAVRRSLGSDDGGPRLCPVSPAGLYRVHGVECDVLELHELVESARRPDATNVAGKLQQALELVRGEPLATALRGFEWFLAEGHLARLLRDGEWAALRLADEARIEGDYELAFWAIERGRLLDPYSEVLEAALHRVPRLREFGGDRPGGAQHEAVGTR